MAKLRLLILGLASWALAGICQAQSVALTGMLGPKALLIIDGSKPLAMAAGETRLGVKVVATTSQQAVLEVAGQRFTLKVGEAPANVGGGNSVNAKVVLIADGNGHFFSAGQVNGKSLQFLVDTGATVVTLGAADAERIGLNYRAGVPVRMDTANGSTMGWRVKLDSVRLGDVTLTSVDAVVAPTTMPYVLLGNSFLTRFQMHRTNDQMVLERRY